MGPLAPLQNGPQVQLPRRVKKILVPTDFSPASNQAIDCAVSIANQYDAQMTLLHVIDVSQQAASGTAQEMMRSLWAEGSTQLGQLCWSLSNRVTAQTLLVEGLPWEAIVDLSRDFDLVVLGRNQSKRKWKLFSHHTGERVVEHSDCPVMVVPSPGHR